MAERLAMAKANVRGYNRTRAKAEPLVEAGIHLVDRPSELAECDIVFTMVSTADDLKSVTFGEHGLFASPDRSPRILVDLSTVSVEASAEIRALQMRAARTCLWFRSAATTSLRVPGGCVMASGPRPVFDIVRPYLSCFGSSVTYIGEGEVARVVKICHNLYLEIMFEGLAEVTLLAEKHGVSRHVFLDVINRSVLGSTFSRYKTPVIANLDYTVTFTNALMRKDLDLGLKAAGECGVALPATQVVRDLVQACIDDGHSERTTLASWTSSRSVPACSSDPKWCRSPTASLERHMQRATQLYADDLTVGFAFRGEAKLLSLEHFFSILGAYRRQTPDPLRSRLCGEDEVRHGRSRMVLLLTAMTAFGATTFSEAIEDAMVALVEQQMRFLRPAFVGDMVTPEFKVASNKPSAGGRRNCRTFRLAFEPSRGARPGRPARLSAASWPGLK